MEVEKMKLNSAFAICPALFPFLVIFVTCWNTFVCADCELAKLRATDGAVADQLGASVAVFGDTAVVGARHDDDEGSYSGSAYVFRFDGSEWIQQDKITADDAAAYDYFGTSVGIFGDTIAVGAPKDDDAGSKSGSVYIFRFDGANWIQEQKIVPSDGAADDEFGTSVGIFGDTVVVGSPYDDDKGSMSGSAYVFRFDGANWSQEVKLIASDGALGDGLGSSVDIFGDVAIVGSPNDDTNGGDSGSAYVYRFTGFSWVTEAKLLASDGSWADSFANAVSVCGDVAIVGAYLDDDNGSNSGSAYAFRFDGLHWNQEDKFIAPDGVTGDFFAKSVAVSGDVVVIGADGDDYHGENSGSGHVFRFTGSSWVHETKLVASDGLGADYFGESVALCGDTVVIGASGDDDKGPGSASAYIFGLEGTTWEEKHFPSVFDDGGFFGRSVSICGDVAMAGESVNVHPSSATIFRFDGSHWFEEARLPVPVGAENDYFGCSVSVSGDAAVIGATFSDVQGLDSGSAYVFRFDGTNWTQEAKLIPSDGDNGDFFGRRVAISGDAAVIGAWNDDDPCNAGSAYIFRFDGSDWLEEAKLIPSDGSEDDKFGLNVAISGDVAVIGARFDDDKGADSGSVYVFRFDGSDWTEQAKLTASDGDADDNFGVSVAISGDTAVIGAFGDDDQGSGSGSAYVFRFDGTDWIEQAKLTASDGDSYDSFGVSVAVSGDIAVIGTNGIDSTGSAYVFHFDGTNWVERTQLVASDADTSHGFGQAVSVFGRTAIVGAPQDSSETAIQCGSVYFFGLALNPGDLNLDNTVDLVDFSLFAHFWLEDDCGPCRCDRADFNRDGNCNHTDLNELTANWLRGK